MIEGNGRLGIRKTWKLAIGGALVRSESGRVMAVAAGDGRTANVPRGSRKDARDAVRAARGALTAWSGRTAYNRGQILYRLAEVLEARTGELAASVASARGIAPARARAELARSVDAAVHYAGWTDKLGAVLGTVNPVALPYFAFTVPEPVGVVAAIAPDEPCLAGLLELLLPVLAGGNVAVAVVSEAHPLASLDLAEVLATSDVPGGVVNLLSGHRAELAVALAAHDDVDAVLDGAGDADLGGELARAAAQAITRYRTPAEPYTLEAVARTLELKTAWHPVGA